MFFPLNWVFFPTEVQYYMSRHVKHQTLCPLLIQPPALQGELPANCAVRPREGVDSNDQDDVKDDGWEGLGIRCWLRGEGMRLSQWWVGQMTWYVILKSWLYVEVVVNEHPATCGGVYVLPLPHWTVLSTLPQTAVPSLPAGRQADRQTDRQTDRQDGSVASSAGGNWSKAVI